MLRHNSLNPIESDESAAACLAGEADHRPTIAHLTASPCFGGPERQMLELGRECASDFRSIYLTFREEERCWDFVENARNRGFHAVGLRNDIPKLWATYRELTKLLKSADASAVVCHGYKSNLLGLLASRALEFPPFRFRAGGLVRVLPSVCMRRSIAACCAGWTTLSVSPKHRQTRFGEPACVRRTSRRFATPCASNALARRIVVIVRDSKRCSSAHHAHRRRSRAPQP